MACTSLAYDLRPGARTFAPSPLWGEGRVRGAAGSRAASAPSARVREQPQKYEGALRRRQTDAARKLWARLRNRRLDVKFRRQHAVDPYSVDFFCSAAPVVIELGGGQHANALERDALRDAFFCANGYRVLRFRNNDVLSTCDGVLQRVAEAVRDPHPDPHPRREREKIGQRCRAVARPSGRGAGMGLTSKGGERPRSETGG